MEKEPDTALLQYSCCNSSLDDVIVHNVSLDYDHSLAAVFFCFLYVIQILLKHVAPVFPCPRRIGPKCAVPCRRRPSQCTPTIRSGYALHTTAT